MTTMKDVARVAGVSLATVSSTLSGAAYVSPALKERVHAAVKQLGYATNSVASGLKKGTTSLVGLIVPDVTNPFYTGLLHAIQRGARDLGYSVLLCDSDQDVERELSLLRLMRAHLAAGTILCPTGPAEAYRTLAAEVGAMALVAVDHPVPGEDFDSITLDNEAAARLATRHIVGFGHKRIGVITGPQHLLPGSGRLEGFAAALREAGVAFDPALARETGFRVDDGYDACRDLLAGPEPPTALFVANNQMLIGVMRALAAAGLSCPRDISVAAIDDFPWAIAFTPTLTTVRQPVEVMAEAALHLLVERIGGSTIPGRRRVFAPELVIRESCAPLRGEPAGTVAGRPRKSRRTPLLSA